MSRPLRFVAPLVGVLCGLALGWWGYPHLIFEPEPAGVPFSHSVHTGEDVAMECTDCHDHGAGRSLAMPALAQCADCHDEIPGMTVTIDDPLLEARPWTSSLQQPEGVRFSHPQHLSLAGLECVACHGDHGSSTSVATVQRNRISQYVRALWGRPGLGPRTAGAGMEMGDCVRCHDQNEVVQSCLDCHR